MKTKATIFMIIAVVLSLVVGAVSAQDGRGNRGRNRDDAGVRFEFMQDFAEILTNATGLTAEEIRTQVQDGSTLAELIEANGGTVDDVVAEMMALAEERVTEAVDNETITEERATQLLENLEERFTGFLNGERPLIPDFGRPGRPGQNMIDRPLVQAVAEAAGLESADVISQVRDGSSLAEILTANNVNVDTFIDDQAAVYEAHLTDRVENGNMSQEVADARLNLFRVQLNDWLNRTVTAPAESE